MKCRGCLGSVVLIAFLFAIDGRAQTHSDEPVFRTSVFAPEVKKLDLKSEVVAPLRFKENHHAIPLSPVRFHKKQFLILSAAVYGASFADMHQTLKERKYDWWYESDPLANHLRDCLRRPTTQPFCNGHRPRLDQLEDGAFQKMAQASGHTTIACHWRQHLRLQEQSILVSCALRLPQGATTSLSFDFTCTAERLEASHPPPRALIKRTLVTSRCP